MNWVNIATGSGAWQCDAGKRTVLPGKDSLYE
jgi:hypothetical protein